MKTLFQSMMSFAVAAMAFTGCSKDSTDPEIEKPGTITMTVVVSDKIENAPLTRTHYDDATQKIYWDGDGSTEVIYVLEQDNATAGKPKESQSANCTVSDGKATFTATFPTNTSADLTYAAIYPASNYITDNMTLDKVKVNLPSAQTPLADSFDPTADLMVTMPVAQTSQPQSLTFRFGRVAAIGKMTITNLGVDADETVKNVSFTAANKVLTGRSYFNITTGRIIEIGYYAPSDKIILDLSSINGIDAASFPVWFTCYSNNLVAGDTFTVVVTSNKNKTYTKEVTLSGTQALSFTQGDITTFTVDMNGITGETSASGSKIATLIYDEVKDLGLAYGTPKEYTNAGGTWIVQAYKPTQAPFGMQLNDNTSGKDSHIKLPTFSQPISTVTVEVAKAGTELALYAANNATSHQYATLVPVVGANTFTITEDFTTAYLKVKGVTIITSVTVTSGSAIRIDDIENVAAIGATASATYATVSFAGDDDTVVTAFDGAVSAASVDNSTKTLTYTVSPNYTGEVREGSITLSSVINAASATVKVSQLADKFEVAPAEITLGGDAGATAELTLTSDYNVETPTVNAPDKFSVTGPVGNVYTVTALADGGAAVAELGTITFTRSDGKTLVIPVSQTAVGGSGSGAPWSHTFSATKEFTSANSTATINGLNWTLATTFNSGSYFANEAGGIHLGSGSSSPKDIIFSTSAYTEGVQSVGFTCKTNDANNWTATVTVGGTELAADPNNKFTTSNTDLKFTSASTLSGEIIITISHSNTNKKNIYIQALSINE